jgi:hypothetical protein
MLIMEDKEEYKEFVMTEKEKKAQEELLSIVHGDMKKENHLPNIVCTYPKNKKEDDTIHSNL